MKTLVRRLAVGLSIAALVAVSGVPVGAGGRAADSAPAAPADHDYVTVRLADAPIASYGGGIPGYARTKPQPGRKLNLNSAGARAYAGYLAGKRQNYKRWLSANAPRAQVVREYGVVFNGLAVKLNGERIEHLATGTGARRVTRSFLVRPTMNYSTGIVGASALWTAAGGVGNAGTGMKVGIIDTGIDTTNPFLSASGYPDVPETDACGPYAKGAPTTTPGPNTTNKVIVCRFYVSGEPSGPGVLLAFDHGTHVAGTVAGNNGTSATVHAVPISGLSGVAPRALLGDYNVFPGFGAGFVAFGGSAFSHDIIRALEDAVMDGMDVVNMSLGGQVQGPFDTLAEATNATVDAGVVAAVAAGNSGPGDATVESPGSAAKALTAGASTNRHFVGQMLTHATAGTGGLALGDFEAFPGDLDDTAYTAVGLACGPLSAATTPLALIARGACTFTTKVRNAENAGYTGVIVRNNVAGDPIGMAQDGTTPVPTIPAGMVSKSYGLALGTSGTVDLNSAKSEIVTSNQDIIAGFSSRGPTPYTYLIKPDVVAPGVNILSSVFEGGFSFFQGTSMATPHLAGAAAMLRQLHPSWSPDDIKSALVSTAKRPVLDFVNGTVPTGAELGVAGREALARGGGRIDLAAANATPLTFAPASVSFGFWGGNKNVMATRTVSVKNVSGVAQSCTVDITGPSIVSGPSVLSVPGTTASFTVMLNAGTADTTDSGDYSGDIEVDCGGSLLRVPWWTRIDRGGKP